MGAEDLDPRAANAPVEDMHWCRSCIRGRGQASPHGAVPEQESALSVLHWDYGFPGATTSVPGGGLLPGGDVSEAQAEADGHSPILCMCDSQAKGLYGYFDPV